MVVKKPPNRFQSIMSMLEKPSPFEDLLQECKLVDRVTARVALQQQELKKAIDLPEYVSLKTDEVLKDLPKTITYLNACKGDDQIIAADNPALGTVCHAVTEEILGIKVSYHDVGVSPYIGNYAEDWILSPLNAYSGFYGQPGGCYPWILDSVKLRNLCAVRKQSSLDMDLASKYKALARNADWVKKGWISYMDHQIALLLATLVFDFRNERDFPFLFKTEGGCGGFPPWRQAATASAALFSFAKGKATDSIHEIMKESIGINDGTKSARNSKYLRAVHMSMHDPKRWLDFCASVDNLKQNGYSEVDLQNLLDQLKEVEELPLELTERSLTLEPQDTYAAGVVSFLRGEGYIMTELDVRVHAMSQTRNEALKDKVPIYVLEEEQKEELLRARRKGFSSLTDFCHLLWKEKADLSLFERALPGSSRSEDIFRAYYKQREVIQPSAFTYDAAIRVFKSSDVLSYYDCNTREPLARSMFPFEGKYDYMPDQLNLAPDSKKRKEQDEVLKWFQGTELTEEALTMSLPMQLGVADPLVLASIKNKVEELGNESNKVAFIIVTGDYSLPRRAAKLHRHIFRIGSKEYLAWCIFTARKYTSKKKKFKKLKDLVRSHRTTFPNLLTGKSCFLSKHICEKIKLKAPNVTGLYYVFDEPNVVKTLQQYTVGQRWTLYRPPRGSYTREKDLARNPSIFTMPIEKIRKQKAPRQVPVNEPKYAPIPQVVWDDSTLYDIIAEEQ